MTHYCYGYNGAEFWQGKCYEGSKGICFYKIDSWGNKREILEDIQKCREGYVCCSDFQIELDEATEDDTDDE